MAMTVPITTLGFMPLEKSVLVLTVNPLDENDAPVTPSAMTWSLTDLAGTVVNSRSNVSLTPATSVTITLSGNDLQLGSSFFNNVREVLVEYTYTSSAGSNLAGKHLVRFEIQPVAGES